MTWRIADFVTIFDDTQVRLRPWNFQKHLCKTGYNVAEKHDLFFTFKLPTIEPVLTRFIVLQLNLCLMVSVCCFSAIIAFVFRL